MCGIAGLIDAGAAPEEDLEPIAARMADELVHRGPDSEGTWCDGAAGVALAHRRLAILDLSPEGAQPMHSASGRFVLTYNGEIYNHAELRDDLAKLGHGFRGHSDTEVLLAAIEAWGVERALQRSNGMFALGLWDRRDRLLYLARDRMGEKPLFHGWFGGTFLFASELKALRAHPACKPSLDRDALALYLRHGYIAAPRSIYEGVRKVLPGELMVVSPGRPAETRSRRYWSMLAAATAGLADPLETSDLDAVDRLELLLRDAVKIRMHADVPLGAFLSGGIDSSTVVALMQAQSPRPVQTFTIGFREDGYDEAHHARRVARHLGTDHTELYLDAEDALSVIPRLPALYDEPFADSSQIPTFLVSQLARRHVTVSLSGDAGDELFCGYPVYQHATAIRAAVARVPVAVRGVAARALLTIPPRAWTRVLALLGPVLPARLRDAKSGQRVLIAAEILRDAKDDGTLYRSLVSPWKRPGDLVRGSCEPPTAFTDPVARPAGSAFADTMMFIDAVTYLPDDILVKVDRASMGVSLEARVPLLDHRVVELAWRLPLALKRRGGVGKSILRQVLYRHVPRDLLDRPKMGFGVPIDSWLRGPLREWAQDLLSHDRLRREGYIESGPVQAMLAEHLSSRRDRSRELWHVLMFEAWAERWASAAARPPERRAREVPLASGS